MPITRCPQCHTAFRVVADQLRVRNGLVRCGVCSTVFDGRASLESEQAPVAPPPMSPFAAPAPLAGDPPVAPAPTVPQFPRSTAPRSGDAYSSTHPGGYPVPPAPVPVASAAPELPVAAAVSAPPAVLRGRTRTSEGGAGQAPAGAVAPQQDVPSHRPPSAASHPPAPVIRARDDSEFSVSQDRVLRAEPATGRRDQRIVAETPSVLRGRAERRQEPAFGASHPPIRAGDDVDDRDDESRRSTAPSPGMDRQPGFRAERDHGDDPPWHVDPPARAREPASRHEAFRADEDQDDEPGCRAEPPLRTRHDEAIRGADDEAGRDDEPQWRAEPPIRGHGRPHDARPFRSSARADPGRNEPGLRHDDEDDIDGASADAVYGDARTRYSSSTDSGRTPPEFLDQDRIDSRRTWRRLWTWACLLGLLALGAQLVFAYRTSIAIAAPALRPALTTLCQAVGCTVGYARRIERISIVSSSLRPPAGAAAQTAGDGRSRLVLTVVLRNRYDKEQHWPALMLDLTDLSDTVVARKAILPEAYLPAGTKGPLGPGAEITLTVPIQVAGLQVNGYQLDKFFP